MNERHIFHLSIPVSELAPAKRFYVEVLGARTGRENDEWLDVLLWGHQITLQRRPEEVVSLEQQGKRHFGVILPWAEWQHEATRIRALGVPFLSEPAVLLSGTSEEQAKFYLQDTSHNVIEVKAYRNLADTLGVGGNWVARARTELTLGSVCLTGARRGANLSRSEAISWYR